MRDTGIAECDGYNVSDNGEWPNERRKVAKSCEREERNDKFEGEESPCSTSRRISDKEFLVEYRGKIYDIKEFVRFHPGGRKTLEHFKRKSIDRVLDEYPHSKAAFHLFEQFALDNKRMYGELESMVDWKAPLLFQVCSLRDRYWEWVNLPVNRPIRLFRSNFLEFLTITPWYIIPIFWIPVCAYFLHEGWRHTGALHHTSNVVSLLEGLLYFAEGVLLWTLMEYLLHRKLFHFRPPPNSRVLITLHFLLHGLHHKAPFDEERLVFPPIPGAVAALVIWKVYMALFPETAAYFIAAGTIGGYLCYDLTHYYLHYGAPKAETYLYTLKRNHNHHHFSQHDKGYGISSQLWDYVFRTSVSLRQLAKPIEW